MMILHGLVLVTLAGIALLLAFLNPRSFAGLVWALGLATVYVGARLLAETDAELVGVALGVLIALGAVGLRVRAVSSDAHHADTQKAALTWQLVGTGALALWALTTPAVTEALGFEGEALDRWTVSLSALFPILGLAGAAPMLFLDRLMAQHPMGLPPGARPVAVQNGLVVAFAVALIFPVNYLANEHDVDWDVSYFRVTKPGTSTMALAASLDEPVEALLFYPPANDVKEEMLPYFEQVAAASNGNLTVKVLDQPTVPALAKELAVRDNGYVVLKQGDRKEKFKIDEEMRKARRELKKLDGTVQKHLLKLAKSKRVAYFVTDHGEATPRSGNPFLKLGEAKKLLLSQNYEVKDFGLEQGSTTEVPEDAALVVLAAPQKALLPEEVEVLKAYVDGGGALLVYADPTADPMTDLLGHLGVAVGEHPLLHASQLVQLQGGAADRVNLYSNRFGSHPVTSTLSKYATRATVVMLGAAAITETGEATAPGPVKHAPLIRSFEDTWADADGDYARGDDEAAGVQVLAMAVEGPKTTPFRAIVVGDVSVASDFVLQRSQGSGVFLLDSMRWLVGDEDIAGEIESEEDVRIQHTRDEDTAWFYGTIFGVPLLILVLGTVLVRRRRTA